jgi:copper(I)-binding protein
VAAKVELRGPSSDPAIDATKPATALPIAVGQDVELNRSGPRLVLSGVTKQLHAYDSFNLTPVFERAGRIVVEVTVEEVEEAPPRSQKP